MAYNSNNEKREELLRVEKNNKGEYIVITKITTASGSVNMDMRLYFTDDKGEVRPTQKGVRFNSELLLEILMSLTKGLESDEVMDLMDKLQDMIDTNEEE